MRGKWNEKTIAQLSAEGRGKGTGSSYKPWLTIADLSSQGRSLRVWSNKTGRMHELFSDVEYRLFLCLEWSQDVVDIREQYPLERDITLEIARSLGLPHPYYPGTKTTTVMTVDFLATRIRSGEHCLEAFNAKRDEEAEDEASMAKLEIQRSYFEALDVPHHLVVHSAIPDLQVRNIEWIRDAMLKHGEQEPHPNYFSGLMARMSAELARGAATMPLNEYCSGFEQRHGAEAGTGLRVARMLMQERILAPNLASPDLASEPVNSFIVTGSKSALRMMRGR